MSYNMHFLRLSCALVLAAGVHSAARAEIIFDNFGAGDTFSAVGRIIQGESVGTIGNVDQAAAFTVGGSPAFLTSITVGLGVSDSPGDGTGPVDVILAADAAGLPGATLRTLPINANIAGDHAFTASDDGSFQLAANTTYWVVADGKTTFDGAWRFNNTGDVGPTAGRSNNGAWNLHLIDGDRYALRVEARVPEPATGALVLVALSTLALVRRRTGG